MGETRKSHRKRGPIVRRLILAVVLFSSAITLLTTALQLYLEYRHDIGQIERNFEVIRSRYLASLASDLWKADQEQIETQLATLQQFPDMVYLAIVVDGKVQASVGAKRGERFLQQDFPLVYGGRNGDREIGLLRAVASIDAVYDRLIDRLALILLSNGVKTFLVVAFILVVFQSLITRHLHTIADHVRRLGGDGLKATSLKLQRAESEGRGDELDDVVSALNQMQSDLKSHFHRLSLSNQAMEATDDGILITDAAQANNPIVYANPAMVRMTGYALSEMLGQNPRFLQGEEHAQPGLELIRAAILEERPVEAEVRNYRKDGSDFLVRVQISPVRDEKGQVSHYVGVQQDVTDRRRTESNLKAREEQLRAIVETAPDAIITIDEKGVVASFSPAAERMFGYAADEVIGHNVKRLMPAPFREEHDGYIARYLRTGKAHIIGKGREVTAQRKDGSVFPMNLAVSEMSFYDKRMFTGVIHDLSERRRTEDLLHHAQKLDALGQLTGGVAHDFNNILTVVSGNLEMLEARLGEERLLDLVKEAQEAADLGAQLTARLLAFSRRSPLTPKLLDLNELVLGVSELLERTLGETVLISLVLSKGLWPVEADPGQVENALLNLAINSRDAMADGGKLTIETRNLQLTDPDVAGLEDLTAGDYVVLTVTDTGCGMSAEVEARVFEPFFTTKEAGKGSGLGLSMVYGFAKQSDGHAAIDSEVGGGTTVSIYLPRTEAAPLAEPTAEAEATASPAAAARVLVVEDNPRVRRVSVSCMKELGYQVSEAADGKAALAILEQDPEIALLFTDIVMPGGMNGRELASAAKALRPDLKVLLTSGYADQSPAAGDGPAEGTRLLPKPYKLSDLKRALGELLPSAEQS